MRICVLSIAAATALTFGSGQLRASVQVGDVITFGNGPGSPGGIFYVDAGFSTFCTEVEEHISFGTKYVVDSLGHQTVQGGRALTPFVAWLYSNYLDGTLSGIHSDNPTAFEANRLQLAIWINLAPGYTEAEIESTIGNTNWYDTYYDQNQYDTWAQEHAASGWSGYGGVQIMNLVRYDNGMRAQDQLVRTGGVVPEPASIAVWSLLAAGIVSLGVRHSRLSRSSFPA